MCYIIPVCFSDVMKLVEIHIRRMWILTFKFCQMQMQIEAFILSVGTKCIDWGQLNDCKNMLFLKVHKNQYSY